MPLRFRYLVISSNHYPLEIDRTQSRQLTARRCKEPSLVSSRRQDIWQASVAESSSKYFPVQYDIPFLLRQDASKEGRDYNKHGPTYAAMDNMYSYSDQE
jgi:uncharacterized protein YbaR (Trm112 family)